MKLIIGLSRGSGSPKYENYGTWLRSRGDEVELLDLYATDNWREELLRIDALIVTGGSDVDPEIYGMPELRAKCEGIDRKRDDMELEMLDIAFERKIPVLGVCRGLQMINVRQGGTLTPHIPDREGLGPYHLNLNGEDQAHDVDVTPGTLLYRATRDTSGHVNSSHHQGIDRLGRDLAASAVAPDGLIEAIEWAHPENHSYMLAVQWHPERLVNMESPFTFGILEQFLFEVGSSKVFSASRPPALKEEPEPLEIPTKKEEEGGGLFNIIR